MLPTPIFIAQPAQLEAFLHAVSDEPALAVDTEANSLFAYRERVCLIQFSTPTRDYILDPLALPDLSGLAPLFANPHQQKIFHAAEYDILCLKRDYGFTFANLFDTMVAARTLGWAQMGLAAILDQHFGVKMDKKHQRANWGHRPLTPEQLDYACLDTRHLIPLRDKLLVELQTAARWEEAAETFDFLTRLKSTPFIRDAHHFWQVDGARDLTPQQAAVLRELWLYRERQAEQSDRPPFKVMSDDTLLKVAQQTPRKPHELQTIAGMTPGQMRRHAQNLLRAVERGLAAHPLRPPRHAPDPDEVRERYERLRQWRKQKAQARQVESDVIMARDAMIEIARQAPRTFADLERIEGLGPWRRKMYGEEILSVVQG